MNFFTITPEIISQITTLAKSFSSSVLDEAPSTAIRFDEGVSVAKAERISVRRNKREAQKVKYILEAVEEAEALKSVIEAERKADSLPEGGGVLATKTIIEKIIIDLCRRQEYRKNELATIQNLIESKKRRPDLKGQLSRLSPIDKILMKASASEAEQDRKNDAYIAERTSYLQSTLAADIETFEFIEKLYGRLIVTSHGLDKARQMLPSFALDAETKIPLVPPAAIGAAAGTTHAVVAATLTKAQTKEKREQDKKSEALCKEGIKLLYGDPLHRREATGEKSLREAVALGNTQAKYRLSRHLLRLDGERGAGECTDANKKESLKLLEELGAAGHAEALMALVEYYGKVGSSDPTKAREFSAKAARVAPEYKPDRGGSVPPPAPDTAPRSNSRLTP